MQFDVLNERFKFAPVETDFAFENASNDNQTQPNEWRPKRLEIQIHLF